MDTLKQKVDQFLTDKLGFTPARSTYVLHQDYELYCRRTKRDHKSESFFVVRSLTSHIRTDSAHRELNLFHEHYGHGLFCEYSLAGIRLWQYEQDLAGLEKQILGMQELPEDVVLTVPADHPVVPEYIRLKNESERFFLENLNRYEGFAYWMETWLGREFKCENRAIPPLYRRLAELYEAKANEEGFMGLLRSVGWNGL